MLMIQVIGEEERTLLICYSRSLCYKMGFPSFGGNSGLVGDKLMREYQDKKRLTGRSMYAETGGRYGKSKGNYTYS